MIAAREQARLYLRAGRFIWNATNISRQIRTQRIDLFADYEAVRIVHWEATLCEAAPRDQTRARDRAAVPWRAPHPFTTPCLSRGPLELASSGASRRLGAREPRPGEQAYVDAQ